MGNIRNFYNKYQLFIILLVVLFTFLSLRSGRKIWHKYDMTNKFIVFLKPKLRVKSINTLPGGSKMMSMLDRVLAERYNVIYDDDNYDVVYSEVYGENSVMDPVTNYKGIKFFYTAEATLPNLEDYDLVIGFNKIEDSKFIRIPYYYLTSREEIKYQDHMRARFGECNPHKEAFACFLVTNNFYTVHDRPGNGKMLDGIPARVSLFEKLSEYKKVESGGMALNNIGYIVKGEDTFTWFSRCKFIIAYENQSFDGYITEKPFNAYFAGAVPIWYGSESAAEDINTKAIIYANKFSNDDAIVDYIKKIDNDDKLYCDIWNENILKEDARSYDQIYQELRERVFKILDEKLKK